jgi:hypothetical protein
MTKYYNSLDAFSNYLGDSSHETLQKWMEDYIFKGYTAPFITISSEQSRSSFVDQIYNLIPYKSRHNLLLAIIRIYKTIPSDYFISEGFINLLKCIVQLNISELLPELIKLAFNGGLKNKSFEGMSNSIDTHTYLLKSIFGMSHEKEELHFVARIALRDINDPKYTLECFYFLMQSAGYYEKCYKFIPNLLTNISSQDRDYEGAIEDYLKLIDDDEIISQINRISKLLQNNYSLLMAFQMILQKCKIVFNEAISDNRIVFSIKKDREKPIPDKFKNPLFPLYEIQMNSEMLEVLNRDSINLN